MALTTRECLVGIDLDVIIKARLKEESILEDIQFSLPKANCKKNTMQPFWEADANVYMRVKGSNLVVMHVQDGYCIIIPEYVRTCGGEKFNVVDELSKYYYGLSSCGSVITSSNGEVGKLIYRQIMSLKHYGDIKVELPEDMEVHHKGRRYLNTEEAMVLVTSEHHDDIHSIIGRSSHRNGRVIHDVEELEVFLDDIKNINAYWGMQPY